MSIGIVNKKSFIDWKSILSVQSDFFKASFSDVLLKDILTQLTDRLDQLNPDYAVNILLMSVDGLTHTAGSRIPKEWVALRTPIPLCDHQGSCGAAGFLKKPVIVGNILEDPLWLAYRKYQPVHGFMACWSMPILDKKGELLATFSIYFKDAYHPSYDELDLFEMLSNTVSVILERKSFEKTLRDVLNVIKARDKRELLVLKEAGLGFWEWDISTGKVERNEHRTAIFGYIHQEIKQSMNQWFELVHPDDREQAWQSVSDMVEGRTSFHSLEYRILNKEGCYLWIYDQASVVQRHKNGKPLRIRGTFRDITRHKQTEQSLIENQIKLNIESSKLQALIHAIPD